METNEKKKSHILKIICLFIILIVIALLARFAWAKYIQLDAGNANAQVAKWHFDLQNSKGEYASVSDIDFPMTRDDGNESVLENKLAPGTSGKFEMIVDTTGTQVQTMYDIQINLTDCPTNLRFYTDSGMSQELEKVQIGNKMVNGQNVKIHKLTLSRYLPLSIVNNKHTETLYWQWPMETGETQAEKDKGNLEDSIWINRDTMTMDIVVTGKQVIDVPSPVAIMSVNTQNQNGSTSSATINKQDVELCDAMNVNVELGESSESTSTFNVSMTNLSDSAYYFDKLNLVSSDGTELNGSIVYNIYGIRETNGDTLGTMIVSGGTVNFQLTFRYAEGETPSNTNNVLNAIINYKLIQEIPNSYVKLDYIQSDGNQYINTGVQFLGYDSSLDVNYLYSFTGETASGKGEGMGVNGAYTGIYKDKFWNHSGVTSNSYIQYGSKYCIKQHITRDIKTDIYTENGEFVESLYRTCPDYVFGKNFLLFAINENGNPSNLTKVIRLYKVTYIKNGELIRYMVPCYRVEDDTIGMYDIVNQEFYQNDGTGTFSVGYR